MKITRQSPVRRSLRPSNLPYLSGAWTPVADEVDAEDLDVVSGAIPQDLDGTYFRNAQNQLHEPPGRFHPFDGDGMIHAITFRDGKARYRNRWVRTQGFNEEQLAGRSLFGGLMEPPGLAQRRTRCVHPGLKDASSTDVVVHAGKVLSTYYQCGEAYRLDPDTLETLGIDAWTPLDGVSAHPKVDEHTGELLFFNYSLRAPYMHYGVVDKTNHLVHYIPVELPGPRLPHDMTFTQNYAIMADLPVFWDPELLKKDVYAVRFFKKQNTRFAIVPRRGSPDQIKWFEAAPTYVLHWLNAYEEGDEIVLDGYFQSNPTPRPLPDVPPEHGHMMAFLDLHSLQARLHRWRFNMKTGETKEQRIADDIAEFGMINQRYAGRPYRYAYSALGKKGMFLFTGLVKHDVQTGQSWQIDLPADEYGSESPFAPRVGAKDEDDGYLVTYTINEATSRSECLVVDAKTMTEVCRVALPHKLCSGTHSCWASREFIEKGVVA